MRIRHADAADAAACAAIYAPSVTDGVASFEEVVPTAEEFASRIARLSASHAFLVAQDGEGVAGFAYAGPHRERSAYRWAADTSVYIHARCRGRGVGRGLYDALLELLRRQGIRTVCAGISLPNPGSVALHEACGFKPVGVYQAIGWKLGAWHDVGWWQLRLDSGPGTAPPEEPAAPARLS